MSTSSNPGEHGSNDKKEMKESSEEIWCGVLPDDVVVEILSRLPPKPFYRFKCVSKTWLNLSSFASRLNKLLLRPTLMGFYCQTSNEIGFSDILGGGGGGGGGEGVVIDGTLSGLPGHDESHILDCCNGRLLVLGVDRLPYISTTYYVYNPTTQKHISIPAAPLVKLVWSATYYNFLYSLAFDPQDRLQFHVVNFWHGHDVHGECINVFSTFSSDSGRWQQGANLGCALKIAQDSKGTFLDGRVHRLTEGHEIVSVDPVDNSYVVTKFDFPGLSNEDFCEIGQSCGLLHFMFGNQSRRISIWVSENGDLQKWIFKHQLSLEEMHFGDVDDSFCNIKLHPEKDALLVRSGGERIISIELGTGESKEICALPHPACDTFWLYTFSWFAQFG